MNDQFSELIGLIYETVLDDQRWSEVLIRLASLSGAHVPAIGFFDPLTKRASTIAPRTDPADILKFETYWAERTPLFSDLSGIPLGLVVNMHELVPASEMKSTPVYNELLRPMGLGSSALLANLLPPGGGHAVLGLYRQSPRQDQPFSRQEVEVVSAVVRHITRAIELRKQMSALRLRENAALLALDRIRKGVLLLDGTGTVVFANALATRMLGIACGPRGDLTEPIASYVRKSMARGEGKIISLSRGSERAPLQLATVSLRANGSAPDLPWLGLFSPAAIVMITDPDLEAEHRAAVIQDRYGLTPAEASFALEIVKGDGRNAAAQRRGISVSTAHTHLNRIFEKTGVTRQAELVRILLENDLLS